MLKYENKILIFFTLVLSLGLIFFIELQFSPDSKTFLSASKSLDSFISIFSVEKPLYLMSYITFKIISFTNNFDFFFKCLNLVSFTLIIIFSRKILSFYKIKFNNHKEYIFFLILFFFNYEILQWTKYALTDLLLVCSILGIIYFFINKRYVLTFLIFLFAVLLKPQSIFIASILLLLFFLNKKKLLLFYSIFFTFYISLISFLFFAYYSNLKLDFFIFDIAQKIFVQKLVEGNIVDDRYYTEFINILSAFKIYFLRLISLFSIYFEEYSFTHKLYKILYFTLLYLPIILFILKKNKFNNDFLIFCLCCILVVSTFIILTFIDYDLRYRLYIFPFIIMISTYCMIRSNLFKD